MNLKQLKTIILGLLIMNIFLTSCGSDSTITSCSDGIQNGSETGVDCGGTCPSCETTVEEDRQNIQNTFDDMLLCLTNIKDSEGIDVLFREFLKLSDGESFNEDWIEDMTSALSVVFDFDHIENNQRFDFTYHSGEYSFDHSSLSWQKSNISDKIIFQFPSEPTLDFNDSEIILNSYVDKKVEIDNETLYLPLQMNCVLTVDNQRIAEVDLSDVIYEENADFEIPVAWNTTLFFDPITINTTLKRVSSTEFDFDVSFLDGEKCNLALEVDFELLDDDLENLSNSSFKKLEAKIIAGDITIQSLAGIAELLAIDNPTSNQLNSLLDLRILFNDTKIADLEYDTELEAFILYYKDSSSEDTEAFWKPFLEDIEDIFDEFFGQ